MNICKKIISTICASVLAFSCFGFNVNSVENEDLVYPVKVNWEATTNTDGTEPITGQIDANVIISDNRNSVKLVVTQDFEAWFPIKISNSIDDFVDIEYNKVVKTNDLKQYNKNNGTFKDPEYFYYIPAKYSDRYGYFLTNSIIFNKSDTFSTGSIIKSGYVLYEISGGEGLSYFMKNTDEIFYGTEQEQYIKQLKEENLKLKTELESYKRIDFDSDGLLTVTDAQVMLQYYVGSLAGKYSGRVEDYGNYVSRIVRTDS